MSVTQIRGSTQIIDQTINNAKILDGTLTDAKISSSAAIAYSKLNLSGSIVNADINAAAAIAYSKLNLSGSIVNADINASAAIAYSKLASLGGSTNAVLIQDGSGHVSASSILSGNLFLADGSVAATGNLNLNSHKLTNVTDPTSAQDAATMNYVDTSSANTNYLHKDGSVAATGNLNMNSHKIVNLTPATASGDAVEFLQAVVTDGSHPITGNQSFSGTAKITNLVDPTLPQDGATKAYVDNAVAGLSWKEAALYVSTAAFSPVTYNNGTSGVGATITNAGTQAAFTIDGSTPSVGDRILIKDQSAGLQNGMYTLTNAGSVSTNWVLTRSTDADSWNEVVGMVAYIVEGSTQAGSKWVNTNVPGGTIGTTAITFTVFSAASALDGIGVAGYNAYWTAPHTLAAEQYVAAARGGLATDASAFTGVVKASSGVFSASTIVNADVNAAAAIAYSKLNLTGSIVNADINATAGIVYSKLSLTNSIVNADISSSAAIAYSKLSLTGSIVNADIASGAAIAYSKLNLTGSIVNADIASGAAIAFSKLANLTSAHILVGNGSNVATDVAVSGDLTLANTGAFTITSTALSASGHFVTREAPSGTIDGSNVTFTLANTPVAGTEEVFVNGILNNVGAGNDYTISSGTITFNVAPQTGDVVLVSYRK